MPTVSFTHRLDADLKAELDKMAHYEDRSTSYMANQAIKAFVQERKATHELIDTGLELINLGAPTISADNLHDWLLSDADTLSPEIKSLTK